MDYIELVNQAMFELSAKGGDASVATIPHHSGVERLTDAGRQTLWIVFAIMLIASVLFVGMTFRVQEKNRVFHYITFAITITAGISYYAMAIGGGAIYVIAPGRNAVRQVLWARYVDWLITTPLLLLDLTLLAGLSPIDIMATVLADVGMILTGLFAALDNGKKTRWGFYTFSCIFFLYVLWSLVFTSRKTAFLRSERVGKLFIAISWYTIILWTLYPIAWALSEGTNYLNSDQEALFYGILDVAAKPIFGAWLLIAHTSIAESNVVLPDSWYEASGAAGGYGAIGSSVPGHD